MCDEMDQTRQLIKYSHSIMIVRKHMPENDSPILIFSETFWQFNN